MVMWGSSPTVIISCVSLPIRYRPFGMTRGCSKRPPKPRVNRGSSRLGRSWASEPHRVWRRLQLLSRMEHHEQDDEQVFPRSARSALGMYQGRNYSHSMRRMKTAEFRVEIYQRGLGRALSARWSRRKVVRGDSASHPHRQAIAAVRCFHLTGCSARNLPQDFDAGCPSVEPDLLNVRDVRYADPAA